jgi:arsenate reductase
MAQGLLDGLGHGGYEALSAGLAASQVRPEAIAVMNEMGIDISHHHSKAMDTFAGQPIDFAVTVCDEAKEACPVFPGAKKQLHWSIPDPSAVEGGEPERLDAFRKARDELIRRIQDEFLGHR